MPQDLRGARRKHAHLGKLARAAQLPGVAQLRAAGQVPHRLIIPHEDDRNLIAGAGAIQGAMPLWQQEAARRQRQARGGERFSVNWNKDVAHLRQGDRHDSAKGQQECSVPQHPSFMLPLSLDVPCCIMELYDVCMAFSVTMHLNCRKETVWVQQKPRQAQDSIFHMAT